MYCDVVGCTCHSFAITTLRQRFTCLDPVISLASEDAGVVSSSDEGDIEDATVLPVAQDEKADV